MLLRIGTLVDKLVAKYNTNCPFEIASIFGIEVDLFPFENNIKGLLLKSPEESHIGINQFLPDYLQRTVLAHELGHYFLSSPGGYFFLVEHTLMQYSKEEIKANLFAAELLIRDEQPMPGETLQQFAARIKMPYEIVELWADKRIKKELL